MTRAQNTSIPTILLPNSQKIDQSCSIDHPQFSLTLSPPVAFEVVGRHSQYLLLSPYAHTTFEFAVGEQLGLRRQWAPGDGFLVPPSTTVRFEVMTPVEMLCLSIDHEYADRVFDQVADGRNWSPMVVDDYRDPGFAALQREIRRAMLVDPLKEQKYFESLVAAMLARLGCYLSGLATAHQKKEMLRPSLVRKLIQHIETNIAEKVTVKSLATLSELSRSHFTRAFHSSMGESPQDFIMNRRIARARELLATEAMSLAEIGAATGFSSQAHMTTAFRKNLGVTPLEYRRSFQATSE